MGVLDGVALVAVKARDGDFYESSSAESRLRELKSLYKNRVLLPGEKRDKSEKDERDEKPGLRIFSNAPRTSLTPPASHIPSPR